MITPHSVVFAASPTSTPQYHMAAWSAAPSPAPATPIWGDRAKRPSFSVKPDVVSVIAPGGGTGINGAVYKDLGQDPSFIVEIVGQSRAPYDIYPETWAQGRGAPNLASFAQDVLDQGVLDRSDCLVCGSRGGQVVLPHFWAMAGDKVPPAVVINGGVAMNLPTSVQWPQNAVTFILIGGEDNFRGHLSPEEYVADTRNRVPAISSTTAILYVNEMMHMPQAKLLAAVLPPMIRVVLQWNADPDNSVLDIMRSVLQAVNQDGWSGRLLFTKGAGVWEDVEFSPFHVGRLPIPIPVETVPLCDDHDVIQHTQHDDMKELWKYAASAVRPGGGAPLRHDGSRMAAVAHAAQTQAAAAAPAVQEAVFLPMPRSDQRRAGLFAPQSEPTPISRALGLNQARPARRRRATVASCNFCCEASPMSPTPVSFTPVLRPQTRHATVAFTHAPRHS